MWCIKWNLQLWGWIFRWQLCRSVKKNLICIRSSCLAIILADDINVFNYCLLSLTLFNCQFWYRNLQLKSYEKNIYFRLILFTFLCNIDWQLEFSSYVYDVDFVNLAEDNIVKTFTDFGLEWEIQFTVTIPNEIYSDWHNIMYISGTTLLLYILFSFIAHTWYCTIDIYSRVGKTGSLGQVPMS